jgi:microcystin-dependent protein
MDGRELDPLAYPDLYAVLGVRFNTGGETPGFFRLPNTAGRVISGAGTPSDPAITTRAVGDKFGEQNHLLASTEMPAHDHGGTSNSGQHDHSGNTTSNGLHNHKVEFTGASNTNNNGSSDRLANVDNQSNPFAGGFSLNAGAHTHNLQIDNGGAHSHNLASAGGGLSHNNLQPSIAAYDIMRVLP